MAREREVRGAWRRRGWVERLPAGWRQGLRRLYYGWQIRRGKFESDEPDFRVLEKLVSAGDQVIDVGANLGTYTLRLSELVGAGGRVFALEPAAETFEVLVSNVRRSQFENVTLLNMAASSAAGLAAFDMPSERFGFAAHYFARLDAGSQTGRQVFCCRIDDLGIAGPVSLVKIDVEGHEADVLRGMRELLERDRPALIVEGDDPDVEELLAPLGYEWRRLAGSQNRIFARPGVMERITV